MLQVNRYFVPNQVWYITPSMPWAGIPVKILPDMVKIKILSSIGMLNNLIAAILIPKKDV